MSHGASVSVIVPSYNYARFLEDCVRSVLSQDSINLRVLILDDASTDSSVEVASRLAAADPRIELRIHARNQGHIDTYNEGIAWAAGTYTVLLDSDDILTPGSLARSCELLHAHPEVGLVYGRVHRFYGDGRPGRARTGRTRWRIHPGIEWFEGRCHLTENCIAQPSVVMRTSILKKVGLFRPELPHTADMEMWLRLSLYADVGYIDGVDQAFYRVHSAGMHRSRFGTVLADLSQVAAAFEILFQERKDRIPNVTQLQESTRRMIARRALDAACRMYDIGRPDVMQAVGLEELALKTYDRAPDLSEWDMLQWRKKVGPLACLALRPFLPATIASRSWRKVQRFRMHRMGLL
jgi:glycosyltransferase involved in cell wall biosynthesis